MNTSGIIEIKIADSKEHLRVISDEVHIQNEILNSKLSKIKELDEQIEARQKELEEIAIKNISITADTDSKLTILADKQNKYLEQERYIVKLVEDSGVELKKISDETIKTKKDYDYNLSCYIEEVKKLGEELVSKTKEIDNLNTKIEELSSILDIKSKELTQLENDTKKKEEEKDRLLKEHDRFVKESAAQKSNILLEIENEKSKISNPMKLLSESNHYLDKKKRNLDILIARFRKEFKKLHPDLDPQI